MLNKNYLQEKCEIAKINNNDTQRISFEILIILIQVKDSGELLEASKV